LDHGIAESVNLRNVPLEWYVALLVTSHAARRLAHTSRQAITRRPTTAAIYKYGNENVHCTDFVTCAVLAIRGDSNYWIVSIGKKCTKMLSFQIAFEHLSKSAVGKYYVTRHSLLSDSQRPVAKGCSTNFASLCYLRLQISDLQFFNFFLLNTS